MARGIQLLSLRDFTGGLNLRADAFQLNENESPDLLNIDVDPRGGFRQRRVVLPFVAGSAGFGSPPNSLWQYATTTGVRQVLAGTGGMIYHSTGGAWTPWAVGRQGPWRATTFKDICYFQNGANGEAALRWDGGTGTSLGTVFNDNLQSPTAVGTPGNMPIAKAITSHVGSVWVANTFEGGKRHHSRIRWSHPNFAEDWRSEDWIDVDPGVDGDEIVALVPHWDRLLIFKKHSIHALYGTDPDTFQVHPVNLEIGTLSQESVVLADDGIYFFSWPDGVFHYDGRKFTWVFDRLYPAVEDGTITESYKAEIQLGWGDRRLYVSVPWDGSSTRARTFVLDPSLGKKGSWVAYGLGLGPFLEWDPPGSDTLVLAGSGNTVVKLNQDGAFDNFGAADVGIESYFRTGWVDLDEPAVRKRWKRPEFLMQAGHDAEVRVRVFVDYDPSFSKKEFVLSTVEEEHPEDDEAGFRWDDTSSLYDTAVWARGGGSAGSLREHNEIHRAQSLGLARSVALDFRCPEDQARWGINSLIFKFIPRKVRS